MNPMQSATSFDEHPLELLHACHQKVRRFSTLCGRLAIHIEQQGVDDGAREAAVNTLRYFDLALPNHHVDEEEDVFPALRALGDPGLNRNIDDVLRQHDALSLMWQEVRPWLAEIAAGNNPTRKPKVLPRFIIEYTDHATREERDVFCAIKRLPASEIERIAQNMLTRRGLKQ